MYCLLYHPRPPIFSYAETHFKFSAPWSPLYKRWPEVFLDAPHQVLAGKALTVWLLVKDADLFPIRICAVDFQLWDTHGHHKTQNFELPAATARCEANLQHRAFTLDRSGFEGTLRIAGRITLEDAKGRRRTIENHNYPGVDAFPLEVELLTTSLPYPVGWHAGEMHCHTEFTSDHVEFGAPLALMQQAAEAIGLDFVLTTDHSYDIPYQRARYLEPTDPYANFEALQAQAHALNAAHPSQPTLIAGEEISCGNTRGQNIHLLAFGPAAFIPGNGDGGRRGLHNTPDLSLEEVLERLGDTPSFAAHPSGHRRKLEQWILGRGPWRSEDLNVRPGAPRVHGLQFWNGTLDRDYHDGKEMWIAELLRGQRVLPIAGSDAHGDFNHNIYVKVPLIKLGHSRKHLFGRVRTVVPALDRSHQALSAAFRDSRSVCTDGPFGSLSPAGGSAASFDGLLVSAHSTVDYGTLVSVQVFGGAHGARTERLVREWVFADHGPFNFEEPVAAANLNGLSYVRLEIATTKGRRALTSAVFRG